MEGLDVTSNDDLLLQCCLKCQVKCAYQVLFMLSFTNNISLQNRVADIIQRYTPITVYKTEPFQTRKI